MTKKYDVLARRIDYEIGGKSLFLRELDQLMVERYKLETALEWDFQDIVICEDADEVKVGDEVRFAWKNTRDNLKNNDFIAVIFIILNLDNKNNPKIKVNEVIG